jgi:exonuclease VII small subunit
MRLRAVEARTARLDEDSRVYSDMIVDTHERVQRLEEGQQRLERDIHDLQGGQQRLEGSVQRLEQGQQRLEGALVVIAQALSVELPPPAAETDAAG